MSDVQSFLNFVNFYGNYIANSTDLTAPLYEFTVGRKGDDVILFSEKHHWVVEKLKRRLFSGPVLAHHDLSRPFIFHTDASKCAIGAVLLQNDPAGIERPVSFFFEEIIIGVTKLFDLRTLMSCCSFGSRTFPSLSAWTPISVAHRPQGFAMAVLEGA